MKRVLLAVAFLAIPFSAFCKPVDWHEPAHISAILTSAERDAGIPIGLAHCVAYTESRFIPTARSRVVRGYRSCGLMQLNRKHLWGDRGLVTKYGRPDFQWENPADSAQVGTRYLAHLIRRFGGSVYLGLVAYNWGPTSLARIESLDEIPPDVVQYASGILKLLDEWQEGWK